MVSGYEARFWETPGRRFQDVGNKPRTMTAFGQSELLTPSSRERAVVAITDQPERNICCNNFKIQTFFSGWFTSSASCCENMFLDWPDWLSAMPGLCLLLFSSIVMGLPRWESLVGLAWGIPTAPRKVSMKLVSACWSSGNSYSHSIRRTNVGSHWYPRLHHLYRQWWSPRQSQERFPNVVHETLLGMTEKRFESITSIEKKTDFKCYL